MVKVTSRRADLGRLRLQCRERREDESQRGDAQLVAIRIVENPALYAVEKPAISSSANYIQEFNQPRSGYKHTGRAPCFIMLELATTNCQLQ